MGFEVQPTRVAPRRMRSSALLVVVAVVAVVAFALVSRVAAPGPSAPPQPAVLAAVPRQAPSGSHVASASPTRADLLAPTPPATSAVTIVGPLFDVLVGSGDSTSPSDATGAGAPGPAAPDPSVATVLTCHAVDVASCGAIAKAAISIIPADWPAVRAAEVWRSLLCDSTLDCPPQLLRAVVPVGSVILQLADRGRPVWVDVVGWRTLSGSSEALQLQAWIARP